MMIRIHTAAVMLLVGLLAVPVLAVERPRQKVQAAPVATSKVPQAQQATVQKRELAKQQRDKKLKIRDANSQAKGGPTTLQKPAGR